MLAQIDLDNLAQARLQDAVSLMQASRFDGAVYMCGYALELKLKSRICLTLGWTDFPETDGEFKGLTSLKTHNFDVLLRFSGLELTVKPLYMLEWSKVSIWKPEFRYRPVGSATSTDAADMIASATTLLGAL